MLSFGMPYDKNKLNKIFDYANKAMQKADDIKRIGPASKDICMVAEGLIDCYFELDLKPWDIQAASLILNEAGGFYKKIDDLYIAYTPSVAKWVEELEFLNERI